LNGIQIQLRSIGFRFSSIEFKLIEQKWDTNWYRKYRKFACNHSVVRIYGKNTNTKRHLSIPLYLGIEYIDYGLKLSEGWLMTSKVVLPKPI